MWMYITIDQRKKGTIKMEKKSIAYEYKTLTVSRKLELQWHDGLEKFGWKLVVSSPDQRFQDPADCGLHWGNGLNGYYGACALRSESS